MYDRRTNGQTLSFGHAGILYRNSFVMYDRTTESLWVHVTGLALGLAAIAASRVMAPVRPYSDAATLLAASGALLGAPLLGVSSLAGAAVTIAFRSLAPMVGLPKPDWPHAAVFGLSAGLWLTWLYGLTV